jgi:hypothetical protein
MASPEEEANFKKRLDGTLKMDIATIVRSDLGYHLNRITVTKLWMVVPALNNDISASPWAIIASNAAISRNVVPAPGRC